MDATPALDSRGASFAKVEAPRRPHPTTVHALAALLILTLRGTMGGAQNGIESAPWGQAQQAWLAACLDWPPGLPAHEPCGSVCALLDPERRPQAVVAWLSALVARCPEIMARDGQALRRPLDRAEGTGPLPGVSAWAAHHAWVLAHCTGEAKSTASPALPARWALRTLAGPVVTIEALGCQVESARQLSAHGGE
jgi:hypothetical protein